MYPAWGQSLEKTFWLILLSQNVNHGSLSTLLVLALELYTLKLVIVKGKVKSLSRVQLFETPWTVAHQAPPSVGFSRQKYWNGLLFPYYSESKECLEVVKTSPDLLPRFTFWDNSISQKVFSRDCPQAGYIIVI